jgi:hypothetical protein
MGLPGDRRRIVGARLATAALVVRDLPMALVEREELRIQVVVVRTGAAVQQKERIPGGGAVGAEMKSRHAAKVAWGCPGELVTARRAGSRNEQQTHEP